MHRKTPLVLALMAWLFATGTPLDFVQTFAWSRMIATYSRSMPLMAAVQKSLSGDEMCAVCKAVQAARDEREPDGARTSAPKAPEKFVFVSAPQAPVFLSPPLKSAGLLSSTAVPVSADRIAPPLPPPRLVA
ncbi:MAG: hypothetical protein JWM88_1150 [Verrucomicrobia bacterium]|nr:hypothetical protein [Verrucomicrobiota bacterium]